MTTGPTSNNPELLSITNRVFSELTSASSASSRGHQGHPSNLSAASKCQFQNPSPTLQFGLPWKWFVLLYTPHPNCATNPPNTPSPLVSWCSSSLILLTYFLLPLTTTQGGPQPQNSSLQPLPNQWHQRVHITKLPDLLFGKTLTQDWPKFFKSTPRLFGYTCAILL